MTSPVDTSVKFFNDGMPGAPVLNGVAGALIALFDACLITGFGLRACTITVASGVATVAVASDVKNLNLADTVQLIAGVAGGMTGFADLNGEQKILPALTATSLKFACPTVADGTATGTITIKQAPIPYWEKTYSTTNVACYRSTDPASLGAFIRVDDTQATHARVRMYETMSAHSTGTNQTPTVGEAADTAVMWMKSVGANSNAVLWDLYADSRVMHFCPLPNTSLNLSVYAQGCYTFGDLLAFKSVDPYAVWLASSNSTSQIGYGSSLFAGQGGASQGNARLLRAYTGLGTSIPAWGIPVSGSLTSGSGNDNLWGTFPSVDGKVRLSQMQANEGAVSGTSCVPRAMFPGLFYVPTAGGAAGFPRGTRMTAAGRVLQVIQQGAGINSAGAFGWIDITGPWRA